MRMQTRLSGLLFFLLLGLCAGSALVMREALQTNARTQAEDLIQISRDSAHNQAKVTARMGARALMARMDFELDELLTRAEAHATLPPTADVPTLSTEESLIHINEGLPPQPADLRLRLLLNARGQLVNPEPVPPIPFPEEPYSLLDLPQSPTAKPLQSLLKVALEGTPVSSIESIPAELMNRLASNESLPAIGDKSVLTLVAIQPIRDPQASVIGALLYAVDINSFDTLLGSWARQFELEKAIASVIHMGKRVLVIGAEEDQEEGLDADQWKTIQTSATPTQQPNNAYITYLPFRNSENEVIGAIEVSVPLAQNSYAELFDREIISQEKLFQNQLSIIGIIGVVALIVGILVSRGLVSSPISRLAKQAEAVSTGKLELSFKDLTGQDELGGIARSLERMRVSLKKLLDRQHPQPENGQTSAEENS